MEHAKSENEVCKLGTNYNNNTFKLLKKIINLPKGIYHKPLEISKYKLCQMVPLVPLVAYSCQKKAP